MKKLISGVLIFLMLMVSNLSTFAEYNNTSSYVSDSYNSKNIIVTDNGVEINGKYYTKEEFEDALQYSFQVKPRAAFAVPVALEGAYWILGVLGLTAYVGSRESVRNAVADVIVNTTDGVILAGGRVVSGGTWLYNSIVNALSSGNVTSLESNYKDSKRKCKPSKNNKTTYNNNNTPNRGKAYSTLDIYKNGILQIRRYFGSNGIAELDVHFSHGDGNNSHTFPHCHKWIQLSNGNWMPSKNPYYCCK